MAVVEVADPGAGRIPVVDRECHPVPGDTLDVATIEDTMADIMVGIIIEVGGLSSRWWLSGYSD